jgi:hypothetical protein
MELSEAELDNLSNPETSSARKRVSGLLLHNKFAFSSSDHSEIAQLATPTRFYVRKGMSNSIRKSLLRFANLIKNISVKYMLSILVFHLTTR